MAVFLELLEALGAVLRFELIHAVLECVIPANVVKSLGRSKVGATNANGGCESVVDFVVEAHFALEFVCGFTRWKTQLGCGIDYMLPFDLVRKGEGFLNTLGSEPGRDIWDSRVVTGRCRR